MAKNKNRASTSTPAPPVRTTNERNTTTKASQPPTRPTNLPSFGITKPLQFLSAHPAGARCNEQALRFVFLVAMLRNASLCTPDIIFCPSKYLRALSSPRRDQLGLHFPATRNKENIFPPTWLPNDAGLASLGVMNLDTTHVRDSIAASKLRLVEDPEWMLGNNGRLLWLASDVAKERIVNKDNDKVRYEERFWLGELEAVLWVGHWTRLMALGVEIERRIPAAREAWWIFFGLLWRPLKGWVRPVDGWVLEEGEYEGRVQPGDDEVVEMEKVLERATGEVPGEAYLVRLEGGRNVSEAVFGLHWDGEFLDQLKGAGELVVGFVAEMEGEIRRNVRGYKHRSANPVVRAQGKGADEERRKVQEFARGTAAQL
ncbi:hypothetical protein OQA88_1426 [Cercophora sp. LCS_1]